MQRRHRRWIWVDGYDTLAKIRDRGVEVRAFCGCCREAFDVDVAALIAVHGEGLSLVGRRGRCRTAGCKGNCSFQVSTGPGTPFRPLVRRG